MTPVAAAVTAPRPAWQVWAAVFVIAILGFAVYANSLGGTFVYDDARLVENNAYITQWSNLSKVLTEDIGAGAGSIYYHYNFYRPVQMLTYIIDHTLWGMEPMGYHLTSVLLHIAVALALFFLVDTLFRDRLVAFLASALFIVHPLHTEAVSYIAGRADPLAAFFMLTFLILYIRAAEKWRATTYIAALACYVLAVLSKEYGLIGFAFVLLYHYAFHKKMEARQIVPLVVTSIVYLFLRSTVFNFPVVNKPMATSFFERLPGFCVALAEYVRLLVLPAGLHMEYGSRTPGFADLRVLAGLAALAAIIFCLIRYRARDRLVFFALGWFLIGLLPVSNLFPINAFMAEHWLYVPSMGIAILAGYGLTVLYRYGWLKVLAAAVAITLVISYGWLTVRQNAYWSDSISFYERTLEFNPGSERVISNLATEYLARGDHQKAIALFQRALKTSNDPAGAYNNLGITYAELGRQDEAVAAYEEAIRLNPSFAEAYNNLGVSYSDMGRKGEAISAFRRAIEINPSFADALSNLAGETDDPAEAIALYKSAITANPYHANACYNLSLVYRRAGRIAEAQKWYRRAKELNPAFP